jgi:hypothetical protein
MSKARVLIPERERPDVVAPLIYDQLPSGRKIVGKGCGKDGGKDGGEKKKEIGKDDKLRPTEGGSASDSYTEHPGL